MRRPTRLPGMILINALAWFAIHMAVAFAAVRLPLRMFNPDGPLFRPHRWEQNGRRYRTLFAIHRWKRLLPDGAALFAGGFRKKRLQSTSSHYLHEFLLETCRAEATHWTVILVTPLFLLWNRRAAAAINIFYALVANLPCIIAQRYNRPLLQRILARRQAVAKTEITP